MKWENLEQQIIKMGKDGLSGTIKEFYFWHLFIYKTENLNYRMFSKIFHSLIKRKVFVNNAHLKNEYIYNQLVEFTPYVEFIAPASLKFSPIQFVRSRLNSFLKFFQVNQDLLYDIIIATVEATENAVKYSSDDKIYVKYFIENHVFYIEIQNKYKVPKIDEDIKNGKYDSSLTLMRGMLVMSKLFDEMDIDLIENKEISIFQGKKVLFKTIQKHETI